MNNILLNFQISLSHKYLVIDAVKILNKIVYFMDSNIIFDFVHSNKS